MSATPRRIVVICGLLGSIVHGSPATAACDSGVNALAICLPNATTTVSLYNGAPVTVRDEQGTAVFAGFVPAAGEVVIGTLEAGADYEVTVGTVLQPVPWPFSPNSSPAIDFVEMRSFKTRFTARCPKGGDLIAVSPLKVPRGVLQGVVGASACGGTTVGKGAPITLELADTFGTVAKKLKTDEFGFFQFKKLNPCLGYRVRLPFQTVAAGALLAGTPRTSIGAIGDEQLYKIGPPALVCDVQPDPP